MGWLSNLMGQHARRTRERELRERYGGLQWCPWCHQIIQEHSDSRMETFSGDEFLDELTCGNCGGTSLWRFEIGMIFICVGEPPKPKARCGFEPSPFIDKVIASAQAHISKRGEGTPNDT